MTRFRVKVRRRESNKENSKLDSPLETFEALPLFPYFPLANHTHSPAMLSRHARTFLRTAPSPSTSTISPCTSIAGARRSKSTQVENNVINFEAKARVREHARRIQTSAQTGAVAGVA
jgi:hypothetical protein